MTDQSSQPDDLQQRKAKLREQMKASLARMEEPQRHAQSLAACTRVSSLDAFRRAMVVMLYMPLRSEVDVTPLALRCFQQSKIVCVPKIDPHRFTITAIEVASFDDHEMEADSLGVRSPNDGRVMPTTMVDLVILPGLAFDVVGRRLGRGKGYYDRFLGRCRNKTTTVGIAFDQQIVDEVPTASHDEYVDTVITDRRTNMVQPVRTRKK